VQELVLNFTSDSIYRNASAIVKIRYYDESVASEWEVYLSGLPNDNQGREVTVNWLSSDIKNNGTFYTDSNGLEMQQRILNFRPSFNFSSFEQVSGNYYPVNSAIAIVDPAARLQMTVLNDRSQGGSVLKQGRIELM
jgi:lysosomal alpha-mannosidase